MDAMLWRLSGLLEDGNWHEDYLLLRMWCLSELWMVERGRLLTDERVMRWQWLLLGVENLSAGRIDDLGLGATHLLW